MPHAPLRDGLYEPDLEHDSCGVGFLADLDGRHRARVLPLALTALGRMGHRGAVDADGRTGDGAGVVTQVPFDALEPELRGRGLGHVSRGDLAVGPRAPAEGTSSPAETAVLRAFGYTREEMQLILGPMYRDGVEPLGSMGDDTPLAVLSGKPRLLFAYFKQRFAQVTNPPIDSLRESLVMSLAVQLGPRGNLLAEAPEHAAQVHLAGPLLRTEDLRALETLYRPGWSSRTLGLLFEAKGGPDAFGSALDALLRGAEGAVLEGATLLVLSDRGVGPERAALPALLAVSAVHQHLVRGGLRLRASLVADTGEARDEHHVAALVGSGASAVCPYLALDAIADAVRAQGVGPAEEREAQGRYLKTLAKGLLKILSKMGISTLRSYHGAQLFEALGIAEDVVDRHFTGTPSFVGGLGLAEIAAEVLERHAAASGSTTGGTRSSSTPARPWSCAT